MQGITLPSMPESLQQVQAERAKSDPDFNRITGIISGDVSLAGEVLKVVNSPAFGLRNPISSIPSAVMLLGLPFVLNLATTVALRGSVGGQRMDRFWDTARDVAATSAAVAKRYTGIPADVAYTLGLFHDCGIPLLMQRNPDYKEVLARAYQQSELSVTEFEEQALQTNHATVGYYVSRSWNLPKEVCTAIRHHHNCHEVCGLNGADADEVITMVAVLNLAEHVSSEFRSVAFRGELSVDHAWERNREKILDRLNIPFEEYEDLRESLLLQLGDG